MDILNILINVDVNQEYAWKDFVTVFYVSLFFYKIFFQVLQSLHFECYGTLKKKLIELLLIE